MYFSFFLFFFSEPNHANFMVGSYVSLSVFYKILAFNLLYCFVLQRLRVTAVDGQRHREQIEEEGISFKRHRPLQPARGSQDGMKHPGPQLQEEVELHLGLVHQEVCINSLAVVVSRSKVKITMSKNVICINFTWCI